MNTDDQMDEDDGNTVDRESAGNYFTANDRDNSVDMKKDNRAMNIDSDIRMAEADNGPKMARNMGFPNMKYLDPETHGDPI